jgi:hypothetical protein
MYVQVHVSVAAPLTKQKLRVWCMAETLSTTWLILVHTPFPLVANSTWHK